MSNEAIDAVKYCSKSKGAQRLILLMIADGTSNVTECYEVGSLRMIATFCNCSERWVQMQLPRLIASGELVVQQRTGHKSLYWIPILEGEAGYEPLTCHDETHECTRFHTPLNRNRYTIKTGEVFRRKAASRDVDPRTRDHPYPRTRDHPTPEHGFAPYP